MLITESYGLQVVSLILFTLPETRTIHEYLENMNYPFGITMFTHSEYDIYFINTFGFPVCLSCFSFFCLVKKKNYGF